MLAKQVCVLCILSVCVRVCCQPPCGGPGNTHLLVV